MVFTKTLTIVGHYKNIKKKDTKTTPKHYLYYNVSKDTCLNLRFIFTNEA